MLWALLVLSLLASRAPLSAEEPGARRWVRQAGQTREFEIALDEVWTAPALEGPQVRPLPAQASVAALRRQTRDLAARPGQPADWVLYEAGRPRSAATRRLLTRAVAFLAGPGADLAALARRPGIVSVQAVPGLPGWHMVESSAPGQALDVADDLQTAPGVVSAEAQTARLHSRKFVPQDPLFAQQWHLCNTGQNGGVPGMDINVTNVWDRYRGAGVVIGIVDDGLQYDHPDLAPNYTAAYSYNFNGHTADPYPSLSSDTHGSQVAGLAGARGNNSIGVCGVAFEARLAGLRLIALPTLDSDDAAAMLHSNDVIAVKNNSWGASDNAGSLGYAFLEGPGPLMQAALAQSAARGRGGRGTVFTFAGGNGGANENVNYDGYANSAYVIAVGAASDRGLQAVYSEAGACLAVCAPSAEQFYSYVCYGGRQSLVTTDLMGSYGDNPRYTTCDLSDYNYTRNFNGTSGATPIVSGVAALLLQARPDLSYRDVKELLLRSATRIIPADPDWQTNRAGIAHNHKAGAGLVNAGAALSLASSWTCLEPMDTLSALQTNLVVPIPDNNANGITRQFTLTNAGFRVEHVLLTVTAPHGNHGNLAITLTSPSGLQSRLAERHNSDGYGYNAWTFTSVRHWGEKAEGVWTVTLADLAQGTTGTLNALHLQLQGSRPRPRLALSRTNSVCRVAVSAAAPGWPCVIETASVLPSSPELWQTAGTVMIGAGGQALLLLTNSAAGAVFYRARLDP